MKFTILLLIGFFAASNAFGVTAQSISNRYKVVGVIAEDQSTQKANEKKGIAVVKDTGSNKTIVLKAGLPFPGQKGLKVVFISKKKIIVNDGRKDIRLSYQGFSGFEGEIASRSSSRSNNRKPARKSKSPWNPSSQTGDFDSEFANGEIPPPFPEEIDELFFQEFGETPIPPDDFLPNNETTRPLSRDELLEKYDFDPEDFSNQELENMVSPAPWSKKSSQ